MKSLAELVVKNKGTRANTRFYFTLSNHFLTILLVLNTSNGLTFTEVNKIVKSSNGATSIRLRDMVRLGYVVKTNKKYFITKLGIMLYAATKHLSEEE